MWLIPTVIFSLLLILGANIHPLWGDEAETALFAKSILKFGYPYGWDGVNLIGGYSDALALNQELINTGITWPQFYLSAVSFAIFGVSSFAARLPFIILSIISLPLLYLLVYKLTQNKVSAFLSIITASLSVPLILYGYQARYYPISIFSGLGLLYATASLFEQKRWAWILFVVSGTLLIYNHFVSFFILFLSIACAFSLTLLIRKENGKEIKKFLFGYLLLGILIALFFSPWFLHFKPLTSREAITLPPAKQFIVALPIVLYQTAINFNATNFFPVGFLLILILVLIRKVRGNQDYRSLLLIGLVSFFYLMIAAILRALLIDTPVNAIRHNSALFPVLIILSAILLSELWRWKPIIFWIVFSLFLFTNIFTFSKPRSLLFEYFEEIRHPYKLPDQVVAEYLKEHAENGDSAFVTLDGHNETLIYYLDQKIRFVNRISPNHSRLFPKNRSILPRYVYFYLQEPDWIIVYSKRGRDGTTMTHDYKNIPAMVNLKDHYQEIILPVYFFDTSQPDLEAHSFRKVEPSYIDQVFLYHKISKNTILDL